MKKWIAAVAACLAMAATSAKAIERPSMAPYGHLPNLESVEVSPDGQLLAIMVSDGEKRVLMVRKTDTSLVTAFDCGAVKVRDVQWAGPGHILVTVSSTAQVIDLEGPRREYYVVTDLDLTTGKQTPLLRNQPDSMNVVLDFPEVRFIDGAPIAFLEGVHFVANAGRNTLYRVNLQTGATRMLDVATDEFTNGWLVDQGGTPYAQTLYNERNGAWSLKIRGPRGWKTVADAIVPMGSYQISGFGRDGRSVLVATTNDKGDTVLHEYGPDGAVADVPDSENLYGLFHDPDTLRLVGGSALTGDRLRYTFFAPEDQTTWDSVLQGFRGDRVHLASWSRDRRKVVVEVDSSSDGPAYALVDLDTQRAKWLGLMYADIKPEGVSPVMAVSYKAADGLKITGYLTLPRGRAPENLPLVVLPHGGPEGRDTPGFDWWSQALAARGYAVLRPNFRGSEGFGWDFVKAGFGQWGRSMQSDLSDGVRELARQGRIDPKRVCIVGASYGGYAALAGATLDQGVYRCAVSVAGPSDLKRMLQDNQKLYAKAPNSAQRYWLRFMGADGAGDPDLAAISPAKLADKVDIPILLIHGKDDTVVPYVQSQIMAAALKKAGKPVEFVTLDGEDHWLSSGATRLKMLDATVTFLEKNNPVE